MVERLSPTTTTTQRPGTIVYERYRVYDPSGSTNFGLQICFVLTMLTLMYLVLRMATSLQTFDQDAYNSKTDLSTAYVRPGLNVDNLPQVKIDFGKFKPSENTGDEESSAGENEESAAAVRTRCLQRGLYLGPNNEYVNCADKCHVSSEKEVQYTFVTNSKRVITGRKEIQAGAWCLPTKAATCNLNSATVVYSLNGWICIPRTDALVGEGGNRIAVCNGSVWDNALRVRYDEYIPSNLVFNDFYEDRLPNNGPYRFVCVPNLRDDLRNRYLQSRLDRFHLLRNYCVTDIPFAVDEALPNFDNGLCNCPPPYISVINTRKCSACSVGFDTNSMTFNFRVQPCFSVRDYVSMLRDMKQNQALPGEVIRPCGLDESDSTGSEVTRPRCIISRIAAFSPFLPSPATLANIRDKLSNR